MTILAGTSVLKTDPPPPPTNTIKVYEIILNLIKGQKYVKNKAGLGSIWAHSDTEQKTLRNMI